MFLNVQSFFRPTADQIIKRVSTGTNGEQSNDDSSNARVSANGRYVVFSSDASNLVAGETNNGTDIFRKDLATGAITRISTGANGEVPISADSANAQLSADGRYVVFESYANNLVAGDTNNAVDIFRKDLVTGAIIRVSTGANGEQATGGGSANAQISADGRYVLFESAANTLVAGDTDNIDDIFRKDLVTGAITRISTGANGEQANFNSEYAQISADGRYVVFASNADNLVAGDTNSESDIFRVDLDYRENAAAIAQGRFVDAVLAVGNASQVSIAWGDGATSTATPVAGQVSLTHAYAAAATKAKAVVSLTEGALTWRVAHNVDVTSSTMVRNTAVADTLEGGAGRDSLNGDRTADVLIGGGGNDRLKGYAGNDRLSGGTGQDTLYGSIGRDVFMFDDRETGSSKSRADYIADFSRRQGDKIDLSAIDANTRKRGDQKFSFIGDEASFSKAGEVRFEKTKSYTYVYLNTDNERAAEGVIKIKGALELQKSWFVL